LDFSTGANKAVFYSGPGNRARALAFADNSPSLGGWLTRDPIGLAGGYLNLRSYLGNRPADELDVWGEEVT
jgi:hypothetical protein